MPLLPEVQSRFAPYWTLCLLDAPGGGPEGSTSADGYAFVCGACASADVRGVGSGFAGVGSYGHKWYEVKCEACGAITELQHEWG